MIRRKIPKTVSINKRIAKLATKALKDKPVWKPAPGYKYLKNLEPGAVFITQSKMKGILIECSTNARVIIIDVPNTRPEDKNYYLGKHIVAAHTEVKEI